MSAQETHAQEQPSVPVQNETRRAALIRRQRQLLHEIDAISQELMNYAMPVSAEEVEPVIRDLHDQKRRLWLEVPEDGMSNILAMYDPTAMEFTQKDASVDAVTLAVLNTMIQRGAYKTSVDLKTHESPLAVRLHIGDEHHQKSLGDGMLLISSLPEATNNAQWFMKIEDGKVVYSDQIAAYNRADLDSKVDQLIEDSEFSMADLEGYYMFVGDTDKLTEFLKTGPTTEAKVEPKVDKVPLEASTAPTTDYLAKIGPQGRIRHHYSTLDLKKISEERGYNVNAVMEAINAMAIERAEDSNFVYVHFTDQ